MTNLTIHGLRFIAPSPSGMALVGSEIRLLYDGMTWRLYHAGEPGTGKRFATRDAAVAWLADQLEQHGASPVFTPKGSK